MQSETDWCIQFNLVTFLFCNSVKVLYYIIIEFITSLANQNVLKENLK
jgi:hypothetical protein